MSASQADSVPHNADNPFDVLGVDASRFTAPCNPMTDGEIGWYEAEAKKHLSTPSAAGLTAAPYSAAQIFRAANILRDRTQWSDLCKGFGGSKANNSWFPEATVGSSLVTRQRHAGEAWQDAATSVSFTSHTVSEEPLLREAFG